MSPQFHFLLMALPRLSDMKLIPIFIFHMELKTKPRSEMRASEEELCKHASTILPFQYL
jgi:hypothetical protein